MAQLKEYARDGAANKISDKSSRGARDGAAERIGNVVARARTMGQHQQTNRQQNNVGAAESVAEARRWERA
jgi:hypothetical protein